MKKKTPYLDFYKLCMETGQMPGEGLCWSLGVNATKLFKPTRKEFGSPPSINGGSSTDAYLWGATGNYNDFEGMDACSVSNGFTPLRQTIVLFLAAMNGELDKHKKQ